MHVDNGNEHRSRRNVTADLDFAVYVREADLQTAALWKAMTMTHLEHQPEQSPEKKNNNNLSLISRNEKQKLENN